MAPMSWPDLVNSALLGTSRRDLTTGGATPELAELLADGDAGPEQLLLRRAAILGLYRQAGAVPARVAVERVGEAPEEARPHCAPAATADAAQMLDGPFAGALPEWLAALEHSGQILRPELLPAALTVATGSKELTALVSAVLGERGRWLAGLREEWRWAAGGDTEERWQTGTREVRRHLLASLRATDPAAARNLLMSTWDEEQARDRELFLSLLKPRLSLDDEPLLERGLEARQQGVRVCAARLLSHLSDSAFARRMADRLRPLIRCGRRQLTVELPELTDALRRDGFTDKPPTPMGKGGWVLLQLVAAAPLAVWDEACGRSGDKIVGMKVADGMGAVLRVGWTDAAARQANPVWASALLDAGNEGRPWELGALLGVVDRPTAEAFLVRHLRGRYVDELPGELTGSWSAEFTARAWDQALGLTYAAGWLRALGRCGDTSVTQRLQADLAKRDLDGATGGHARDALALLTFRQSMLTHLTEAP